MRSKGKKIEREGKNEIWEGERKDWREVARRGEVSSCRGIEEDRRANKDIESWLKTWRRNRAYSARQIFDIRDYSLFRQRTKTRTFISPLFSVS